MKIFKVAVIALIAACSFSSADAQVIVKAKIGSGHVVQRQDRRPVHRKVYHRRRRVVHRAPVRHRVVVRHDRH